MAGGLAAAVEPRRIAAAAAAREGGSEGAGRGAAWGDGSDGRVEAGRAPCAGQRGWSGRTLEGGVVAGVGGRAVGEGPGGGGCSGRSPP